MTGMYDDTPYTRRECESLSKGLPERGIYCPACRVLIPRFADLTPEREAKLLALIEDRKTFEARRTLEGWTGCSGAFSKIWVVHAGQPSPKPEVGICPYCEGELRTPKARQCQHCLMDWHDPDNPRQLEGENTRDQASRCRLMR